MINYLSHLIFPLFPYIIYIKKELLQNTVYTQYMNETLAVSMSYHVYSSYSVTAPSFLS